MEPTTGSRTVHEAAEAFGAAFAALMGRLTAELESLADHADEPAGLERRRRAVIASHADAVERLLAQHVVSDTVAQYVRHVVREGYESDFDPMDPSETAPHPAAAPGTWSASAPSAPGPYAVRLPAADGGVELALFEPRVEGPETTWLVYRWGVPGVTRWSEMAADGWSRWSAPAPLPGA